MTSQELALTAALSPPAGRSVNRLLLKPLLRFVVGVSGKVLVFLLDQHQKLWNATRRWHAAPRKFQLDSLLQMPLWGRRLM